MTLTLPGASRRTLVALVLLIVSAMSTTTLLLFPKRIATVPVAIVGTLAWLCLGAYVWVENHHPTVSSKMVLTITGLAILVAVVIPPRGSDDIWSYAMYGRIVAVHHSSPYTRLPDQFTDDPYYGKISTYWTHQGSVYGPAFTGLSTVVMAATGTSKQASRIAFQAIAAASVLAALFLLKRRGVDAVALAIVGLNPVMVASVVNGGHNDALVGLLILAATFLVIDDRPRLAGVLGALALCTKVVAFLPIGALIVWAWFRRSKRSAIEMAAFSGGLSILMLIPAGGMAAFGPIRNSSDLVNTGSVWWAFYNWLRRSLLHQGYASTLAQSIASHRTATIATAAFMALALIVVWGHRHDIDPVIALGGASLAYFLLAAYIQPWYLAWTLPVMALRRRSVPALILAGYSALIMLSLQYWWHAPHRERPLPGLFSQPYLGIFEVIGVIAMVWLSAARLRRRGDDSIDVPSPEAVRQ